MIQLRRQCWLVSSKQEVALCHRDQWGYLIWSEIRFWLFQVQQRKRAQMYTNKLLGFESGELKKNDRNGTESIWSTGAVIFLYNLCFCFVLSFGLGHMRDVILSHATPLLCWLGKDWLSLRLGKDYCFFFMAMCASTVHMSALITHDNIWRHLLREW